MTIGNFCAELFTDTFMGGGVSSERFGFSTPPRGGALTLAVVLGGGS
jgi:hypothetical protein